MKTFDGIAPEIGHRKLIKKNGRISDIIKKITSLITARTEQQVKGFAAQFSKDKAGLYQLWLWVRQNVRYVEDGDKQIIKDPASLVSIGYGDCKSMTLFVASIIENWGFDFIIKYVHYPDTGTNHVYCVAVLPSGEKVICDTVWDTFNAEKQGYEIIDCQYFKNQKNMELYHFSGVGKIGNTEGGMSEAQANAIVAEINRAVANIPDTVLTNDITEMSKSQAMRYLTNGRYNAQNFVGAIDNTPAFTLPTLIFGGERVGSVLSKVASAFKTALKKLINYIFKNPLKKAAPFFLFSFAKTSLGVVANTKRGKQIRWIQWLAKVTGTSEDLIKTNMAAAITEQYGKSPLELLRSKNPKIGSSQKVGVAVAAILAAVGPIVEIVEKIVNLFKKKDNPELGQNDGSDINDIVIEQNDIDTTTKPLNTEGGGSQNTMILVGAGLLALFVLTK